MHRIQITEARKIAERIGAAAAGLIPCIVDPTIELAATLKRRRWKSKDHGSTFEDREKVWTPPRQSKSKI